MVGHPRPIRPRQSVYQQGSALKQVSSAGMLAGIVGARFGGHSGNALAKLGQIYVGACHETEPSKESCL
jgi:hypothetical protein